ncbi:DUF4272 domain-containing protein [Pseudomonas sp. QD4]|uniref:DUF4272 domain-containing protein n=1 Tax=Pseudomonas sp. QD4 TaxID=3368618 RepID=UPI003BA0A50A
MAFISRNNTLAGLLLAAATLHGSLAQAQTKSFEERKQQIHAMDQQVSAEGSARKERSEALLRAEGVPLPAGLPAIATQANAHPRSTDAVAYRAMALLVVSAKGSGLDQPTVDKLVEGYNLTPRFTPEESLFIANPQPSEEQRIKFSWRYESAWVLLWALGYVDTLDKPQNVCDVNSAAAIMLKRTPEEFIADAKPRPLQEVLDQTDRTYRYDWNVVEARMKNTAPPAGLDASVTYERHYAFNWLMGYMGQEWDDVNTDT